MNVKHQIKKKWKAFKTLSTSFKREVSGAIAIEFAFVLPVLIVIYFGMVEMGNAISADRKVTLLASTVGDIISQFGEISQSDLDQIFLASAETLRPYEVASDNLNIEVYSITTNETNDQVQSWPGKVTNGGSCGEANNTTPTVPTAMLATSTSVIVAKVCYRYESVLHYFFNTDPTFEEVFYIRPRYVDAIDWKG